MIGCGFILYPLYSGTSWICNQEKKIGWNHTVVSCCSVSHFCFGDLFVCLWWMLGLKLKTLKKPDKHLPLSHYPLCPAHCCVRVYAHAHIVVLRASCMFHLLCHHSTVQASVGTREVPSGQCFSTSLML